ncbi:MAG: alpha-mannosidase, partial [Clostridia bacterium]|nr:alpha-mannosidase [Clostridia bacterium]
MKKFHLISNAHLDPIWQWEWEEGAAAALSTFRCAARFCREFDGYIFCHNEDLIYRWVEEYEPALFAEIRELVKLGKWHIMGGWHVQPDCNLPSGEGFARQITEGRRYFAEKFGKEPTTAINFDPFGHTRGLVQIMAKSGYDSYLFCRPDPANCPLPAETFTWVGYDGSTVTGQRAAEGYGSSLGHALDKIRALEGRDVGKGLNFALWGVGNHGGGPSREDIRAIDGYIAECRERGIEVIHSTPEDYFADVKKYGVELPRHEGDINLWAPGCYTSQVRIKQKYRQTENMLFSTEKMYTQLVSLGKGTYPEKEFGEVLYDMLTVQFHDVLPGSSVLPAEEMALRMLDHALEILSRLRLRAFLALSDGEPEAPTGEIPVLVYNPHPYSVTEDIMCEFMLADQNWSGTFHNPVAYRDGVRLPTQCEKEYSNIPLDWRKRVIFRAELAPMSMNRFDCRIEVLDKKPVPDTKALFGDDPDIMLFVTPHMAVEINRKTGLIDRWTAGGKTYLGENSCTIDVMQDVHDAWGMTFRDWSNKIGSFHLLSAEEGSKFSDQDDVIPSIRIIEDGPVRTVVEAVFGYEGSGARILYKLSKQAAQIDVDVRIVNQEKRKMFKLGLTPAMKDYSPALEVAFGEEPMKRERENVGHKYLTVTSPDGARLSILNRGIYGSSWLGDTLYLTLLHSPGHTTHPIGDRPTLPSDRHADYMEQGER